jgi:alpha-beta hydrolase superfamily lysophospholipase
MTTQASTFEFADQDGQRIFVYRWSPAGPAKAVVQIAHGAVEHALRYERVAEFLNDHGYAVYANDHRGHGRTAGAIEAAGKAGDDGWNAIVRGFAQLTDIIRAEQPGLPVFVLGHSMGSIVAQQDIEQHGAGLAGAILSGSWGTLGDTTALQAAVDAAIAAQGRDAPSMEFLGLFAGFNAPFEGRTPFDWLSRDQAEVDAYIADPWSGSFAFSNGLVADFFAGMTEIWRPENEGRIPRDLPVLIVSGSQDPAGGFTAGTQVLVDRYRAAGIRDVTSKFYPGARHEILNETNRDEVQADILGWLDAHLPPAG